MSSKQNRVRKNRVAQRGYRQKEVEKDPIMLTVGMQIMLAIIMLASVMLLKHFDFEKYERTMESLENLASVKVSAETLKDSVNVFSFSYDYVSSIIERTATELVDRDKNKEENSEKEPRSYGEARLTGQGGLNPVKWRSAEDRLKPPQNATFSPIMTSAELLAPISGKVTSGFGYRYHPMTDGMDFHTGIDIAAPMDTDILSVLPGKVIDVGVSDIYGNYISIEHGSGFVTTYSHCSEIIADVGSRLKRGERIAKVGSTGISTGPHLHFEIKINNIFADPAWVLLGS